MSQPEKGGEINRPLPPNCVQFACCSSTGIIEADLTSCVRISLATSVVDRTQPLPGHRSLQSALMAPSISCCIHLSSGVEIKPSLYHWRDTVWFHLLLDLHKNFSNNDICLSRTTLGANANPFLRIFFSFNILNFICISVFF